MNDIVWITWQQHRRTDELVDALNAKLVIVETSAPKFIKHLALCFNTIPILFRHRNYDVIVQNPSRILAMIAAVFKYIFGYRLTVDRHTNFRIGKKFSWDPRIWLLTLFSNLSLRMADLTIVTNEHLKGVVESHGGRAIVLPDRLPTIESATKNLEQTEDYAVFICTYADDEPFLSVIEASKALSRGKIYITGNYKKANLDKSVVDSATLELTGFLSEENYISLLSNASAIIDFTTMEWCLVCGGYECMALEKPFITSDTRALNELFKDAALYSDHSPANIAEKVIYAFENKVELTRRIQTRKADFSETWRTDFKQLVSYFES